MKNIMKNSLDYKTAILTVLLLFTACDKDKSIDIIDDNEEFYQTSDNSFAYLLDEKGKRSSSLVEFRNETTTNVYVALTKNVPSDVEGKLKYNLEALKAYNSEKGTSYKAFPQELAEFDGTTHIAKDTGKSDKVSIHLTSGDALDADKTYVLPLSAELASKEVQFAQNSSNYFIFIKDLSKIPDPKKVPDPDKFPEGIKIFSCMGVNPLNNLCFKLKKSGKPLVDCVILFAANTFFNPETGRMYVFLNRTMRHLLDNSEKYIKPLQDQGIKVILGLLSGYIKKLSDETAKDYAQELKAVCDAYHLDGVFFDEEYDVPELPEGYDKGLVSGSNKAAARLVYETKQVMPDRLVTTFVYSSLSSLPEVDGHLPGTFVDYALHNYFMGYDLSSSYPGIPKSGMGLYSQEFYQGKYATAQNLKSLRKGGYGANMIFEMNPRSKDPNQSSFNAQKTAMQRMAKYLFDDELEIYGADGVKMDIDHIDQSKFYQKDW